MKSGSVVGVRPFDLHSIKLIDITHGTQKELQQETTFIIINEGTSSKSKANEETFFKVMLIS